MSTSQLVIIRTVGPVKYEHQLYFLLQYYYVLDECMVATPQGAT